MGKYASRAPPGGCSAAAARAPCSGREESGGAAGESGRARRRPLGGTNLAGEAEGMIAERHSDQELVGRAKQGDNGAFGELWRRHEPHVLRLCRRYLGGGSSRDPGAEPEDLALDTFIRALHYLHRYEDQSAQGAG